MSEDIQHYHDLIEETRKHLRVLELQKVQYGLNVPPHIENGIAKCQADIEAYTARMQTGPPPSDEAQRKVDGNAELIVLKYRFDLLHKLVEDALVSIEKQQKTRDEQYRASLDAFRQQITYDSQANAQWKAEERNQRKAGQDRNEGRLGKLETDMTVVREWQEHITIMFRSWISRVMIVALLIIVAAAAFYLGAHR